jgi:hypothetical protein
VRFFTQTLGPGAGLVEVNTMELTLSRRTMTGEARV